MSVIAKVSGERSSVQTHDDNDYDDGGVKLIEDNERLPVSVPQGCQKEILLVE